MPNNNQPLTTQAKIALANHNKLKVLKNIPREAPNLNLTTTTKPPSERPRSFAPPGEQAWLDEALTRKQQQKKKKQSSKKPLTTQEMLRAAKKSERKVAPGLLEGEVVAGTGGEFARPDLSIDGGGGIDDDDDGGEADDEVVDEDGEEEREGEVGGGASRLNADDDEEEEEEVEEIVHSGIGTGEASAGGMIGGDGQGFMKPLTPRASMTASEMGKKKSKPQPPRLMEVMESYMPTTKAFSVTSPIAADTNADTDAEAPKPVPAPKKGTKEKKKTKKSKITPKIRLDMATVTATSPPSCSSSSNKTKTPHQPPSVLHRRTTRSTLYISLTRQRALASNPSLRLLATAPDVLKTLHTIETKNGGNPLPRNEVMLETIPKLLTLLEGGAIFSSPILAADGTEMPMRGQGFRLLDLPEELRREVWRWVVVETKAFVFPETRTGREQPDAGMVSRQVRGEVLPIFYRENRFAVDVAPVRAKEEEGGSGLRRFEAVRKWVKVIEEAGWWKYIRHWVFTHTPERVRLERTQLPVLPITGSGFVPTFLRGMGQEDWFMVSLDLIYKKDRGWDIGMEVHREASCIMPDLDSYGACHVKRSPRWLNEKLIESLDVAGAKVVPAELVLELAEMVQGRDEEFVELRCSECASSEVSQTASVDV